MVNRVFAVEKFIYRVKYEKYEPSEDEIKTIGELLGQPTKKLNVVLDRYKQIFSRYIEKRCVDVDNKSLCIYVWNQKVPFKVFPMSMHLTGTIILFEDMYPKEVIAYPIPKALSYAKSSDVPEEKYCSVKPKEVSKRVDGWQLTAYFNPLLNRWIFATRYVLHNMYFEKGRLVIESFDSIANPYVYVADKIAQEENLYSLLDRFRGWTFTFVLEGPEPAITRPPYPLGDDYRKYKLYLVMARDPEGKLYTWSESVRILGYRGVEIVEPKTLHELHRDVVRKVDVRSYLAYVDTQDPENPLLIELESDVYPEAMEVKYLYSAKAAALLIVEGLGDELKKILNKIVEKQLDELSQEVSRLRLMISSIREEAIISASWEIVKTINEFRSDVDVKVEEISKALKENNINRVVKKILGIILENQSLVGRTTLEMLTMFNNTLEQRLKTL
jgi:hypothetical protein